MKEAREHLFSRTLKVSETVPASYPAQLQGLEEVTIVVASHRHRRENVSIRGFMRLGLCVPDSQWVWQWLRHTKCSALKELTYWLH